MASQAARGGALTPKQQAVLAAVSHYHQAIGEAAPAAYVARKLSITRQRVLVYFQALSDLGWLRSSGSPAVPARPYPPLTISQLPADEAVGHALPVRAANLDALETRKVEMPPLSLRAEVAAKSFDDEARTVELVFTTGAAVERWDWMSGKRYLETLSLDPAHVRLDRLNAGASLLDSHSGWSVTNILGAVVPGSAQIAKKGGRALVRFSRRADVEPVWQDVKDEIVRFVSVGYRVYRFEETVGKGNALPVRKAIDWEPFEVSMVPIPADAGSRVRAESGIELNPCEIVTRGHEDNGQEDRMKDDAATGQDRGTGADPKPPVATPPAPTADAGAARAAGVQEERERSAAIRKAVAAAKFDPKMAEDLVARGVTADVARAEILEKLAGGTDAIAPKGAELRVAVGDDAADKRRTGISAWLAQRAAVGDLIRQAAKARPDHPAFKDATPDAGEYRGLSLLDLARECLEAAGVRTRGMDRMQLAGLALRHSVIGNTTSDYVIALENVLNKTLLASFVVTPDTWTRFCGVGSVTDFRAHPRYRTGYLGRLDKVLEGGEFKQKNIPDAVKESITADTKGNILALSRQAIINDDMSVFSRVATQLGRAAKLSIEMDVYDLLALNAGLGPLMSDGLSLFHATHLNIGTGSALSVAGLDADRVVLASQKDPSGNEILDLRPAVLVIAIGLGGQARVINQAQYDTDIVANKFLVPNKVVGLFRDIVDTPRLSGTRRYLFTDPAQMPVIEVAFLEGVQEPFLEMQEGWRTDGVEWKARLDWGVAAVEFRGAVTNAGV